MPRISAPTVKEHRQVVLTALVDSAERLLRDEGPAALTAGAVSADAGIARNSIYRYVDSVDDLRGMVLARYLPQWLDAVGSALDAIDDPRERILVWVTSTVEQAAVRGHSWLMDVARSMPDVNEVRQDVRAAHDHGAEFLAVEFQRMGLDAVATRTVMVRALVDAAFGSVDNGEPLDAVVELLRNSVSGLLEPTRVAAGR